MLNLVLFIILNFFVQNSGAPPQIENKPVSWGFKKCETGRKENINSIIIHSTFNALDKDSFDVAKIIDIYKRYRVSPHYLIGRDGKIYRLVNEQDIAFHAGKSKLPNGQTDVNACSIGIEIINSYTEPPTEKQYNSLFLLTKMLIGRYKIKFILGHADIAPGRKIDPYVFNWKLYSHFIKHELKADKIILPE